MYSWVRMSTLDMYSYPTTGVVIKRNLKKKDQTLKIYYKNMNCLRRGSSVPFQSWRWALPGWDSAPDLPNGLASDLILGLQFPHLYQGEVDPVVSESLRPWHQVTRSWLGYAGPSLCHEGSLQKQRFGPSFGSGCHPPKSVGGSRETLGSVGRPAELPSWRGGERGGILPGPWKPSEFPGLGTVRPNAGIAAGLIVSLSGFGIEQPWPVCVIKTEMVWLGTLAQWPCPPAPITMTTAQ